MVGETGVVRRGCKIDMRGHRGCAERHLREREGLQWVVIIGSGMVGTKKMGYGERTDYA